MFRIFLQNHPTMGPYYSRFDSAPGWVKKCALAAAVLMVVVPLVILTVAALTVGIVVFVALAAIVTVGLIIRRMFSRLRPPTDDGRRNVRVIHRT